MGGGVRVTAMLICFGLGYSAEHFVENFGQKSSIASSAPCAAPSAPPR